MDDNGWVKIHRKIMKNKIWLSEPFNKALAWVDLILMADYDNGSVTISNSELCSRWKWGRHKVNRFLNFLIEENCIEETEDLGRMIRSIKIKNYSKHNNTAEKEGLAPVSAPPLHQSLHHSLHHSLHQSLASKTEDVAPLSAPLSAPPSAPPLHHSLHHPFINKRSMKEEEKNMSMKGSSFLNNVKQNYDDIYENNHSALFRNAVNTIHALSERWINERRDEFSEVKSIFLEKVGIEKDDIERFNSAVRNYEKQFSDGETSVKYVMRLTRFIKEWKNYEN